jgi:hypothetical protein
LRDIARFENELIQMERCRTRSEYENPIRHLELAFSLPADSLVSIRVSL